MFVLTSLAVCNNKKNGGMIRRLIQRCLLLEINQSDGGFATQLCFIGGGKTVGVHNRE